MAIDDFDPFGFGAISRRQERDVALARTAPAGIGREHLVPGALVTISTNKATGDRSYTGDIHEVLAVVGNTVALKPTGLCERPWSDKARLLQIHEHEFYAAEAVAQAIRDRGEASSC